MTRLASFAACFCFCLLPALVQAADNYSIRIPIADGFDYAVGKPNGAGYYVYRGFWPNAHLGEDWNGRGGGDTDLGDPVYSIGDGVVVFSADYQRRWGNVIIVRHAYRENDGKLTVVDSLYGHLDRRMAKLYQVVKRGQQIGTIGNCRGIYAAHLHLEVRKNLSIGMNRSAYAKDYSNYHAPRKFIDARRSLNSRGETTMVKVNTFGSGGDAGEDAATAVLPGKEKPVVPDRLPPKTNADEEKRKKLEDQIKKLAEENRKKSEEAKEEDMDSFWKKLKDKLGRK